MEENQNNENKAKDVSKIELTPDGHLEMLRKVVQFKIEERDMALDRYRRTDQDMQTHEQVFMLGKTAISFLNTASNASTILNDLVKDMGKIVYQTDQPTVINNNFGEETKQAISEDVQKILRERRAKKNIKKSPEATDKNEE